MVTRVPSTSRESTAPPDIARQVALGQWLVAASGGLTAAVGGRHLEGAEKVALDILKDTLSSAAAQESLVAISGELGLVSAREAAFLVDAVGDEAVPALVEMANAVARVLDGADVPLDDPGLARTRRLLLAISELRLAQARQMDRSDPSEPWWPTTLSSAL